MAGFVYVLTNDLMPRCVKVGCTTRDPQQRARELSTSTGVPAPFRVALYGAADENLRGHEAEMHLCLAPWRLTQSREFFGCLDDGSFTHVLHAFMGLWQRELVVVDRLFHARRAPAGHA